MADELLEQRLRALDLAGLASAETSQKVQTANVPSSPERPSAFSPSWSR